jgi:hypothetical protein
MATSTSRLSYDDAFTVMDEAIADPKGARVMFDNHGQATYFKMRLHSARQIDRNDNKQIFAEGEKLYGRSVYDTLVVRVRGPDEDGKWWVYLENVLLNIQGKLERLSDLEEAP